MALLDLHAWQSSTFEVLLSGRLLQKSKTIRKLFWGREVGCVKVAALNDLYRRDAKEGVSGFGKRTISSGGAPAALEEDPLLAKRAKKNMSKIKCKACGQVSRLPSSHWSLPADQAQMPIKRCEACSPKFFLIEHTSL